LQEESWDEYQDKEQLKDDITLDEHEVSAEK
jgi:hypothetical protein